MTTARRAAAVRYAGTEIALIADPLCGLDPDKRKRIDKVLDMLYEQAQASGLREAVQECERLGEGYTLHEVWGCGSEEDIARAAANDAYRYMAKWCKEQIEALHPPAARPGEEGNYKRTVVEPAKRLADKLDQLSARKELGG